MCFKKKKKILYMLAVVLGINTFPDPQKKPMVHNPKFVERGLWYTLTDTKTPVSRRMPLPHKVFCVYWQKYQVYRFFNKYCWHHYLFLFFFLL